MAARGRRGPTDRPRTPWPRQFAGHRTVPPHHSDPAGPSPRRTGTDPTEEADRDTKLVASTRARASRATAPSRADDTRDRSPLWASSVGRNRPVQGVAYPVEVPNSSTANLRPSRSVRLGRAQPNGLETTASAHARSGWPSEIRHRMVAGTEVEYVKSDPCHHHNGVTARRPCALAARRIESDGHCNVLVANR